MEDDLFKLVVAGISHKTASIAEREKYQINKKDLKTALNFFKSKSDVEGIVIVSTCSRLEFYLSLKHGADPFPIINDFYFRKGKVTTPVNVELFYLYEGTGAARHLFNVAAGLDSILPGEYLVLRQLKDDYSIACGERTADKILHGLFHAAFHSGKLVRAKTGLDSDCLSLSEAAFKIIKERLKKEDVITIVGVNQSTRFIADKLSRAGFSRLIFVNRTLYKAEELADRHNGVAFNLDCIEEPMISSKCIFSCTGAPGFIVGSNLINKIYSKIKLPKLIIDMSVPRDIETDGLSNEIEVVDLDVLKKCLDEKKTEYGPGLHEAEKIMAEEAAMFRVRDESQKDGGYLKLEEKMEAIRLHLLDETKPCVSSGEFMMLERFSRSLIHRMRSTIIQHVSTNCL